MLLDGVDVVQEVADARTKLSGVVSQLTVLAVEEDVATRITKLTDDFSKVTGDLATALQRISAQETKSADANTKMDNTKTELSGGIDTANQKISELEKDMAAFNASSSQLRMDVVKLKEQISAADNHPRAAEYFEIDRNSNTCNDCSFAYHWTSESYFAAEVVITMGQSNGGAENNLYIRGIWHQNHLSHNWEELEHIGGISALTKVAITATDKDGKLGTNSNTGRLALELDYTQASFLGGRVMIRPFWFASLVSSKKFGWKETPKPILGTAKDHPATTCKEIKEKTKSAESGIYWLKPKDDENVFATHCEMTEDGGGWSVVLKFGDTKDQIPGFFNNYMEGGRLYTAGDCAENHASSRYTRRFPKAMFTEVAVLCVDSKFKNVNGTCVCACLYVCICVRVCAYRLCHHIVGTQQSDSLDILTDTCHATHDNTDVCTYDGATRVCARACARACVCWGGRQQRCCHRLKILILKNEIKRLDWNCFH